MLLSQQSDRRGLLKLKLHAQLGITSGARLTRGQHLNLSVISPPMMPSGKPGKFSTSVVVVSWPPAAMPLASHPSKRMGCSSARAEYIAAVCAAGPEPIIHKLVLSCCTILAAVDAKPLHSLLMRTPAACANMHVWEDSMRALQLKAMFERSTEEGLG